jgi:preprotein translocase subunit YajC
MRVAFPNIFFAMGAAPQGGQQGGPPGWTMLPYLAIMLVVLYFLTIRPQQKKQREQAELLKTLKAGDKILTNSGIVGTVITVKDKSVTMRSADSKFEVTKSAVAEITERSGEASES